MQIRWLRQSSRFQQSLTREGIRTSCITDAFYEYIIVRFVNAVMQLDCHDYIGEVWNDLKIYTEITKCSASLDRGDSVCKNEIQFRTFLKKLNLKIK